ncbi:acyltransferase [Homoserinibacter sp. GY 40078]|uniref:acyltransferase family protein n=1 Tax=Homoserinibacter sp. GY 40078 TaxID=2603275 RepID=UPI00164F222F|nr:acyltransferase [Homoserinibacter sp. GY 40078]
MTARNPGLDAIRGLAVLLVLLRHAYPEVFGGAGLVGVVIFFALSGFLITQLIVRDLDKFGRLRFGRFYWHRFIRLYPALMLMILVFSTVTLIADPLNDRESLPVSVAVALGYVANIPGIEKGSIALAHLWTLATEEQFYLIWPLILIFAVRRRRVGLLLSGAAVAIIAFTVVGLVIAWPDVDRVYTSGVPWAMAMVLGSASALFRAQVFTRLTNIPRIARLLLAILILTSLSFTPDLKNQVWVYFAGAALVWACTMLLISIALESTSVAGPRLLAPLQRLGLISYAAYLWNLPLVEWIGATDLGAWAPPISFVLTILAAYASQLIVERPASRLRQFRIRPTGNEGPVSP